MDYMFSVENILGDNIGKIDVARVDGDDLFIASSARQSTTRDNKTYDEDVKLIRRMLRDKHTSPFEMCGLVLDFVMPLFVRDHIVRHRTFRFNIFSGRYSQFEDEFYIPNTFYYQSKSNHQGSGEEMEPYKQKYFHYNMQEINEKIYKTYADFISLGMAKEQARLILPASTYTKLRISMDLNNLMKFLLLRNDSHAQYETRMYAKAIEDVIFPKYFPVVHQAFKDYMRGV